MIGASELYCTAAVFFGTFLLTRSFLRFLWRKKRAGNSPPSLPTLPFLGSIPLLWLIDQEHIYYMEKARELGPVFTFACPSSVVLVINGREMIYEAFVKQSNVFASRHHFFTLRFTNPGRKGFVDHPYDSEFRRYHQLSLNILKKLGFGKGIMETRIQVEVEDLLASIQRLNGSAICANDLITRGVSNVIVSIILGERYNQLSPELTQLIETSRQFMCLNRDFSLVDFFPTIRFLPKYRRYLDDVTKVQDDLLMYMNSKIDAGLQGELPESFITHFLEMEGPDFDRDQLLFMLRDLYVAGTESTSNTLQWALIFLANHPGIQKRLHAEVDSVVPRDRLPGLDDRRQLPLSEAVILELLRIKTVLPFGLTHETLHDTHLNGYFIPKGTMVSANLYSAHMDPTVWIDPQTFNPDRFLRDSNRQDVINKDTIIPFSMGRRSCLGELLAQQELFLFLTGVVQNFEIRPPDGQLTVDYKEFNGITMVPIDYEVRLLPRPS